MPVSNASATLRRGCLLVGLLTAWVTSPSVATAQVSVRGAVFEAEDTLLAVWHDNGLHVAQGEGGFVFTCTSAMPPIRAILTPGFGRLLLAGDAGPSLSTDQGCKWKQTTGPHSLDSVIGMHQDPANPEHVIFALGELGLLTETQDGGHTLVDKPLASFGDTTFDAFSGNGTRLLLTGKTQVDQVGRFWWSDDLGQSFVEGVVGEAGPYEILQVGVEQAWLVRGTELFTLALAEAKLAKQSTLIASPESATLDPSGTLWLALGAGGLWKTSVGSDPVQVRSESATWISSQGPSLWLGAEVRGWGEAAILKSTDGGTIWESAFVFSEDLSFPSGCQTLMTKQCEASVAEWALDFDPSTDKDATGGPELTTPPADDGGCRSSHGAPPIALILVLLLIAPNLRKQRSVRYSHPVPGAVLRSVSPRGL